MNKKLMAEVDHIDIVTTHMCNMNCQHCIDKFIRTSNDIISLETIENFLQALQGNTAEETSVLLLGGEPTVLPLEKIKGITETIRKYGFQPIVSTNGKLRHKIIKLLPLFDWIQVTMHSDEEIEFYKQSPNKINAKLSGDENLTLESMEEFIQKTECFGRTSLSMYFTPDFKELCKDRRVFALFNTLEWIQNGSYLYTFYKGMRIKRCIPNVTNIANEPTIPKLYPNGNYNQTWNDENMDDYLEIN